MAVILMSSQIVRAAQTSELTALLDSPSGVHSSYSSVFINEKTITESNWKSWFIVSTVLAITGGVVYYCCCCLKDDPKDDQQDDGTEIVGNGIESVSGESREDLPEEIKFSAPTQQKLIQHNRGLKSIPEANEDNSGGTPDRGSIVSSVMDLGSNSHDLEQLKLAIINSGLLREIQEERLDTISFSNFFYAFGRGDYDDLSLPFSIGAFMTEEEGRLYLLHKTQQGLVKAFDQAYSLKDNGVYVSICEYMEQGRLGSVLGGETDFSDNKVRERVLKALSSYSIFGDSQEVSEAVGTSSGGSSRRGSSVSSRSSVAQAKPLIEQERIDGLNSYVESLVGDQEAGRVLYQEFRGSLLTHVFEKREEGYPVQYIVELMRSESEKRHILESVASVLENPISAGLFLEVLFPITDQDEALNLLLRISGFGLEYSRSAGLKYAFGDQKEKLTLPRSVGVLRTDKTIHVMSLESRSAFFKSSK